MSLLLLGAVSAVFALTFAFALPAGVLALANWLDRRALRVAQRELDREERP